MPVPVPWSGEEVAAAIRAAFQKYLRFDGTAHAKTPLTLHFGERWAPLLTKLFYHGDGPHRRSGHRPIRRAGGRKRHGAGVQCPALPISRSNERETEDRDYVERCFGRSLYAPQELALMEQRDCTGNHLGCHLWFTRGEPSPDKPVSADAQRLFQQAEEQAKRNRAAYVKNQRPLSERPPAADGADPQLHADPPAAGRRLRPAGPSGQPAGLAAARAGRR